MTPEQETKLSHLRFHRRRVLVMQNQPNVEIQSSLWWIQFVESCLSSKTEFILELRLHLIVKQVLMNLLFFL